MPVHDVFKARQGGLCVGGKLEGGALKPGSKVLLVPGYEAATVKSLEVNGQVGCCSCSVLSHDNRHPPHACDMDMQHMCLMLCLVCSWGAVPLACLADMPACPQSNAKLVLVKEVLPVISHRILKTSVCHSHLVVNHVCVCATVCCLQDHAPLALAGDSADVLLSGIDAAALHAGAVLCHPEFPVHLAVKFTVQVLVLQVSLPILKGHAVTIHAHTAREAGVMSALLGLCDSKTGQHRQHKPRCLLSGQVSGDSGFNKS
jgi:hypothetical protein